MYTLIRRLLAACALTCCAPALAIPEGPEPNSAAWFQREALNYARTLEGPTEQVSNPTFLLRFQTQSTLNQLEHAQRMLDDPTWLTAPNLPVLPLCSTWSEPCVGDPFRYPGSDPFYETEGEVIPFTIYDDGCARLTGRVWAPRGSQAGAGLPAVVIENGSIQAPEPLYWWMAQALVRAGYVVLTFDPRGQGRSDLATPSGEQGSNFNSAVFWTGLVNVIDFFRSSPVQPYPHNATCAGTYPTAVMDFNPFHDRIDANRLGIAGHSLGASGVSIVQGYGAPGAEPWPGLIDAENPVKVAVGWDSLSGSATPRVPAMGHTSEYGIGGTPFQSAPDPEEHKGAYKAWTEAGLPVYQLTIQGSTHFEWSLIPTFPSTSWCPDTSNGRCEGGWGRPMAEHYTLAWFDRWLKLPGEAGYDDADARLLADADWHERTSFYFRSARSFPTRDKQPQVCEDIRAGCVQTQSAAAKAASTRFGGALGGLLLLPLLIIGLRRR